MGVSPPLNPKGIVQILQWRYVNATISPIRTVEGDKSMTHTSLYSWYGVRGSPKALPNL